MPNTQNPKTRTPYAITRITPELPRRRYYEVDEVAWLTGLPERVIRENIMLSRTRS